MDRCGHQINATERRVKQTEETRTGSCDDSCRLNCFEARRGGCPHPPGGAKLRKTASCCSRPDEGVRAYVIVIDLDLKRRNTMKAISVFPGKPNSVHVAELPKPSVDQVPNGRGVLVKVLRVGVDGTDKEINAAEYGAAPPGYDFLVIGHEGFGRVEANAVWKLTDWAITLRMMSYLLVVEQHRTQIGIHALLKCQQENLYHEQNVTHIQTSP